MIREVERFLPAERLVSLDDDLEPSEGEREDLGNGIDVAGMWPDLCGVHARVSLNAHEHIGWPSH
jgi:hypothetical protein